MNHPRDPGAASGGLPRPPAASPDNLSGTRTPAQGPGDLSIIVVGDLVTDVLVVTPGALAVGSDTTGTIRFTGAERLRPVGLAPG